MIVHRWDAGTTCKIHTRVVVEDYISIYDSNRRVEVSCATFWPCEH